MEHTEMLDKFIKLSLKAGDNIRLTMNDGAEIDGELSSNKVHAEYDKDEKLINSRIGLHVVPPEGNPLNRKLTPFYTENIKEIKKLE